MKLGIGLKYSRKSGHSGNEYGGKIEFQRVEVRQGPIDLTKTRYSPGFNKDRSITVMVKGADDNTDVVGRAAVTFPNEVAVSVAYAILAVAGGHINKEILDIST